MDIRLLSGKDALLYMNLRLEGLQKHPYAFGSSYEEEKLNTVEKYEERLNGELFFTYGAFIDNKLVGTVTLILESKIKLKHRANIVAMYVQEESRKLGVGKRLMTEAINKAKSISGLTQIYLTVTSINEPAKRLYNSLGFICYGKDINALKVDNVFYDEDLMVLLIN